MIPFKSIPRNLRVPLFFAELDASRANTAQVPQRTLLIGQKTAAGALVPNLPSIALSQGDSRTAAGNGSVLAAMIDAYRANDSFGEVWLLPVSDDITAIAAQGTITINGSTTAPGTLSLYVAGQLVSITLGANQTGAQIAAVVAASINANIDLPVTAAVANAVVTLTARNRGECGNDIDVRANYLGAPGGQSYPAGIAITVAAMTGGATNPSLTAALAALQDTTFDVIVCSLTDAASLASIAALLNDANGRWSWQSQVYGHCFVAKRGSAGLNAAFASGLNNQHISSIAFADSPSPAWCWAAAFAGAAAVSLRQDPGLPLQTLAVAGILAPPLSSRYPLSIRNTTLLYGGASTWTVTSAGQIVIENIITTYVTNAAGQPDNSYLQIETMFTLVAVLRRMQSVVSAKYSRVKLAADGTRLLPGSNVVTPSVIKADLIAAYRQMEGEGLVQQSDAFAQALVVEKNALNPNRVDVLYPAVLINQLRTFALLAQFRLN